MSSSTPTPSTTQPSHPAHNLLRRAHSPTTAASIFTEKVLHKPLLLSTTATPPDNRTKRRHIRLRRKAYALKHARPRPLSAAEKRRLALYELKPEECRYEVYRELHALWRRYILEVLGYLDRSGGVVADRAGRGVDVASAGAAIAAADFHGMEVEVVRCEDAGSVGLRGIVVRETKGSLTLVCDEKEDSSRKLKKMEKGKAELGRLDKLRMVLKNGTVFRVRIGLPTPAEGTRKESETEQREQTTSNNKQDEPGQRQLVFELHGSMLETRPVERATKKFKFQWKAMDYV